jgi:hypothetical protein
MYECHPNITVVICLFPNAYSLYIMWISDLHFLPGKAESSLLSKCMLQKPYVVQFCYVLKLQYGYNMFWTLCSFIIS